VALVGFRAGVADGFIQWWCGKVLRQGGLHSVAATFCNIMLELSGQFSRVRAVVLLRGPIGWLRFDY
jgi:hypothetical protein